jgi:hypothetical protein
MSSQTKKWWQQTNVPPSQAILMTMTMRWCNAEHIDRCRSMTRASLDAISRRHWPSICPLLPQQTLWFLHQELSCDVWYCSFWSYQSKGTNGLSTKLIKATRCNEILQMWWIWRKCVPKRNTIQVLSSCWHGQHNIIVFDLCVFFRLRCLKFTLKWTQ